MEDEHPWPRSGITRDEVGQVTYHDRNLPGLP
jgi:hypothetical protein